MRFMMLMIPKGYEKAAPGVMPDAKSVGAMMKYNKSLQKAGILLALDGLHPPSMGARVSFSGGKARVTDGPFPEAKEVVGGYWMIQVKSKEEAIEWAKRVPFEPGLQPGGEAEIEIRQIFELDDFGTTNADFIYIGGPLAWLPLRPWYHAAVLAKFSSKFRNFF